MEKDASDIIAEAVLGLVATPFMAVPLLSRAVTEAYIQRKKNKLMFYRLFNFIPREVTGNGKKNKGFFASLWK